MPMTNYGLSALASAVQGSVYSPPLYLVIENNGSTVSSTVAAGVSSISLVARADLAGDTQLLLGVGLASQETVTFTSVTGSGPYVYTLSGPTTQPHTAGDPACRVPLSTDTMTQVVNEQQYDSANDPNQRAQTIGGYSTGTGQWTMQFFLSGIEANTFIMTVGISDSPTIGQGNLHAHVVLGANHAYTSGAGVDMEIDIPISLA